MRISEMMTRDVEVVAPGDTVQRAAKLMDDLNVGALPVCDGRKLVGMITDRDITVRATSTGRAPGECQVRDAMSGDVRWAFEDEEVDEVTERMADSQIRRVPVVDKGDHSLVGIVSLGDVATGRGGRAGETLKEVSQPSRPDR